MQIKYTKLDVLLTAAKRLDVNSVTYVVKALLKDPAYYKRVSA